MEFNMQIDPNHKSGNAALDRTLALVGDTFRPERKEREAIVLKGHQVKQLVDIRRYTFDEACELMDSCEAKVGVALFWLKDDDERMTREHAYTPRCRAHSFDMLAWFRRNTPMSGFGESLFNMMAAINHATALQMEVGQ
jgi:hypothetical protein